MSRIFCSHATTTAGSVKSRSPCVAPLAGMPPADDSFLVADDLVDLDLSCRTDAFGVGQLPVAMGLEVDQANPQSGQHSLGRTLRLRDGSCLLIRFELSTWPSAGSPTTSL